jgi:photosystem II stability/assembly factor-like uncharacterized protein
VGGGSLSRHFAVLAGAALLAALGVPIANVSAGNPKPPLPKSAPAPGMPPFTYASGSRGTPHAPATQQKVPSAASWTWQNPKPNGASLYAISCPTGATCFAAGENGPILMTANGGATWTQQTAVTGLFAMSCPSTSICVGVGNGGLVWTTSNGGGTWSSQTINGGNYLDGVSCPSTTVCFAVGFGGSAFTSGNGGTTWTALSSGTTASLYAISCPSTTTCFAVGEAGTHLRTTDGGTTWTPLSGGSQAFLTGISCPSVTTCWTVGQYGNYMSTSDGGATWSFPSSTGVTLSAISCAAPSQCVATRVDGEVLIFSSGTFGPSSTTATGALFAVSCPVAGVCFAVGDYGAIVTTSNGGTGWKAKSPSTTANLLAISCATASTCLASGQAGGQNRYPTVVTTSDAGANWVIQNSIGNLSSAFGMQTVSCFSPTICYGVDYTGAIYKSSDGGISWSLSSTFTQPSIFRINCPTANVCYVVGTSGFIAATTNGGLSWNGQAGAQGNAAIDGLSCASASVCYAAVFNGGILATTDSGAHWNAQATPTQGWRGISCPSTTVCFAVGDHGMLATTNGGTTWTDETPAGNTDTFPDVSCSTTTTCVAVAYNGAIFGTSNGTTWTAQTSGTTTQLTGVSCAGATTCFAVGNQGLIIETTDGGATPWSLQAPNGPSTWVFGVSCLTTTTCLAISPPDVFATTNGGTRWSSVFNESTVVFASISCAGSGSCFVVANRNFNQTAVAQLFGTTDGGATWPIKIILNRAETFVGISCPSATTCFAVSSAGNVWTTNDAWTTWHSYPVTGTGLNAINCPSTTVCFAVDNPSGGGMMIAPPPGNVFSTTNGGANWNLSFSLGHDTQAAGVGAFTAVNCPDVMTCYAAGPGNLIAITTDGGAAWRTGNLPASWVISGLSCPTVSTCFASSLNSAILHTTDFGSTWEVQDPVGGGNYGISCLSLVTCYAVGGSISKTTTGGAAWTRLQPAGTIEDIHSLSCSGSNCYAAALHTLLSSHDAGATWSSHSVTTGDLLVGMSCPGPNTCFAVGWPGAIYATGDGGSTWSYQPNVLSRADETLVAVSCSTVTRCVAVGTDGSVLSTTNGTTWSAESSGTVQTMTGVSCPSTSSCVAVGVGGLALTRSSGSWQSQNTGTSNDLHGVSCPTAGTCFAVGDAGTVLMTANRGATWSTQTSGTPDNLFGILCLNTTTCMAAGSAGGAVLTADGRTWSTLPLPTHYALLTAAFAGSGQAELAGLGGTILANANLVQSCTSAALSASPVSPVGAGTQVTLTASSSGCPNPQYEFWLQYPDGSSSLKQPFGSSTTWSWDTTGYPLGTYTIKVWANQAGDPTVSYEAIGSLTFTLTGCNGAALGASPGSPQPTGAQVQLTATSTGCPKPQYEFWLQYPNGTWVMKQPFGTSAVWNWDTTGYSAGTYTIHVWANAVGEPTTTWEAFGEATYKLTLAPACATASLSPVNPSAPAGTIVALTASSTGCPNPLYEFWVQYRDGSWHVHQPFGASTFNWGTAGFAPGTYVVHVWANQAGDPMSTWEAYGSDTVTLTGCTSASLTPPSGSSAAGPPVTFTASSIGCPTPVYEFWLQYPNGSWVMKRAFATGTTWQWDTSGLPKGSYTVHVWANNQSADTTTWEAYGTATWTLT